MLASHRDRTPHSRPRSFTLVELVMVVVIIGIVAGIAVPRMSSASANASANAMQATLMSVRTAIECYYAEHNRYPGYDSTGSVSGDRFVQQLLMYSDASGNSNATRSSAFKFGPYLRAPFPVNPANHLANVYVKETRTAPNPADGSVGWVAVLATGDFGVSATDEQLDKLGVTEALGKAGARLQIN